MRLAIRETYESLCRQLEAAPYANDEDQAQFEQHCDALSIDVMRSDTAYDSSEAAREGRLAQLRRILKAYTFLNRVPGYVQGMSGEGKGEAGGKKKASELICIFPQTCWSPSSTCWRTSRWPSTRCCST